MVWLTLRKDLDWISFSRMATVTASRLSSRMNARLNRMVFWVSVHSLPDLATKSKFFRPTKGLPKMPLR